MVMSTMIYYAKVPMCPEQIPPKQKTLLSHGNPFQQRQAHPLLLWFRIHTSLQSIIGLHLTPLYVYRHREDTCGTRMSLRMAFSTFDLVFRKYIFYIESGDNLARLLLSIFILSTFFNKCIPRS